MIDTPCPKCGAVLGIPDQYAGTTGACTKCGGRFRVPGNALSRAERARVHAQQVATASVPSGLDARSAARPFGGMRPDAGMLATEGETGGGLGASLGRMAVLLCLVSVIAICVVPAVVIGFSAETKPPAPEHPIVLPTARGPATVTAAAAGARAGARAGAEEAAVKSAAPEVMPASIAGTPAKESVMIDGGERVVYVTRSGLRYHRESCAHLRAGSASLRLVDAKTSGYTACRSCGG